MERLPAEVVTHVMRYLNLSDRKDASLVNHTWYEASRDPALVQDVVFLVPKNGTPNVKTAAEGKNRHLVLENINAQSDIVKNCEAMCSGLESLSVRGTDISEGMLIMLLSHCRVLQSLDLSCCNSLFMTGMLLSKQEDVDRLKCTMSTLRSLNLSSIRYLSDATFNRLIMVAPNLEKLTLSGCQIMFHTNVYSSDHLTACNNTAVITFKNIAHYINSHATKLKALDFGRTRINNEALKFLAGTPALHLREIYLDSCREISDEGISQLCKKQTLTHLDISHCMDLTDAALHAIVTQLPGLKVLSMSKCRQMTDASVSRLSRLLHLRELNLSSCYSLTAQGLQHGICTSVDPRSLTHLTLSGCNGVSDMFMVELCKTVPGLMHLDLGSCFALHDSSVHAISRYLLRLRFLRLAWCKEVSDYALLGVPNPEGDTGGTGGNAPPLIRRQPSKIFGDLASLLPDRPPTELSEEAVESLKSQHTTQTGSIFPISNLQHLCVLDLSSLPQLTDASIKDAVKFNQLQEFYLGMSSGITDAALFAIGNNLPSVEVLDLNHCRRITDDGLIFLIVRLRRLRSLNISNCDSITDASIEALAAHAPYLKYLDVSMCGGVSAECIDKMEHSMRHLTCVKKRLIGGGGYNAA